MAMTYPVSIGYTVHKLLGLKVKKMHSVSPSHSLVHWIPNQRSSSLEDPLQWKVHVVANRIKVDSHIHQNYTLAVTVVILIYTQCSISGISSIGCVDNTPALLGQ